jgi:hypothetical protein
MGHAGQGDARSEVPSDPPSSPKARLTKPVVIFFNSRTLIP